MPIMEVEAVFGDVPVLVQNLAKDDFTVEPRQSHATDLGYDLTICRRTVCLPATWTDVPHGIACRFPAGVGARIVGRSSTLRKRGLLVQEGVIDPDYTGELFSCVWNPQPDAVLLEEGDRIAQRIVIPRIGATFEWVEVLPETLRGANGFGSTGT